MCEPQHMAVGIAQHYSPIYSTFYIFEIEKHSFFAARRWREAQWMEWNVCIYRHRRCLLTFSYSAKSRRDRSGSLARRAE